MGRLSILVVIGTRPEAIKMAPVVHALRARGARVSLCTSGQHADLVAPALAAFGLGADIELGLSPDPGDPGAYCGRLIVALSGHVTQARPDLVLVHGDTTTALAAAQAAFFAKIPVAHVEAGLRSGDLASPWPEEMNRGLIARLARDHFAPTLIARQALLAEGVADGSILVTGNTAIDALEAMRRRLSADAALRRAAETACARLRDNAATIIATFHRRESQGAGQRRICDALRRIAARADVDIVVPLHPNPEVSRVARHELAGVDAVHLVPPLDYPGLVWLMGRVRAIATDSGGLQEEAPWMGVPVVVLRDKTERPEILSSGAGELAGTDPARIVAAMDRALARGVEPPGRHLCFGDGQAAERIAKAVMAA